MNVFIYWSLIVFNRLVGNLNNMGQEMTDHLQLMLVVRVRGTCAISPCLSSTLVLRLLYIYIYIYIYMFIYIYIYMCVYIYIYI